jgi:hypothetical protein
MVYGGGRMTEIIANGDSTGEFSVEITESGIEIDGNVSEELEQDIESVENYNTVTQIFDEIEGPSDERVQGEKYEPAEVKPKVERTIEFLEVFGFVVSIND